MASLQHQDPSAPVPFFEDTRTLVEKLHADNQEWRPHQPEHGCPSMIFGLVLELGTFTSEYGANENRHTARLLTEDNLIWSVIAFHGYLQSEFERKRPAEGDFVAIAYLGTKAARKSGESDAHVYQMEVERKPPTLVPAEADDVPDDEPAAEPDESPELPPAAGAVHEEVGVNGAGVDETYDGIPF